MLGADRRQGGYTVSEAAEILQFHPDAVRYWLRVGELTGAPGVVEGGWVIWPKDLVAFLRQNGEMMPASLPTSEEVAGVR